MDRYAAWPLISFLILWKTCPEGTIELSPTPQGLRRDRGSWFVRMTAVGCAVVCEGDLGVLTPGIHKMKRAALKGR